MRIPMKLYLIVFVCAFIILVQYHIYNPWVIPNGINNNVNEVRQEVSERKLQVLCNNVTPDDGSDLPPLFIITPTYKRPEQLAELTRLSHTLMHVPNLTWLVIEDAYKRNDLIEELLSRSGLRYQYMVEDPSEIGSLTENECIQYFTKVLYVCLALSKLSLATEETSSDSYSSTPMPVEFKNKTRGPKPRGVSNRNKGLQWIRQNAKSGVFYFADDDNTYDLELFKQIRYTKRVSMFPVGLITKAGVSSPIVRNGVFSGFYDGWIGGRKFAVDMAGFAVSVEFLLLRPHAVMPFKPGFEEDGFLKSLSPFEPKQVELLATNCTKILVWHTQTKKNEPSLPIDMNKYNNSNLIMLKKILV